MNYWQNSKYRFNYQFAKFSKRALRRLNYLNTAKKITEYVEKLDYNYSDNSLSPLDVLKLNKAHCLEAALTAACLFYFNGDKPLLLDLRSVRDEDHVLCVYQLNGLWGSVAKSKFIGLRSREPVYRTIRELALSYFENYYNFAGEKTLREYSIPLNLLQFDNSGWMINQSAQKNISIKLDSIKHFRIIPQNQEKFLNRITGAKFLAGTIDCKIKNLNEADKKSNNQFELT